MSHIETNELGFRYRGDRQWTFTDISIDIEVGSCVLLLGPSGSGKSTLARCFNGLVPHAVPGELTGEITVCDFDVADADQVTLARRVGLVFQNPESQFVTSTVETEVAFGLENLRLPPDEIGDRIAAALEAVSLSGFEDRRIDTLSGGEKQRLAVACQLAMEPEMLVLDEPTANLDPQGTETVYELVRELAGDDDRTLIVIEHQCESLVDVFDRVVVLETDGGILHDGTPTEVLSKHARLLREEGVWIPEVTRLGLALREDGHWPVSEPLPLTAEQAADTVRAVSASGGERSRHQPDSQTDCGEFERMSVTADACGQSTGPPALEIRGLTAGYDSNERNAPVLSDVDLTVPKGTFLALVGANGAGKSTLAKHCVGVHSPPPGTVFVDGRDVTELPASEISRHVGYVFQNPESQFVTDTVRAELAYGLRQLDIDTDDIDRRVERTLERFDLSEHADANPYTLSHGEKRRLSVATMLVVGQETLIVDEPTYGQDRANTDALLETLSQLHDDGRTVVVLTHDMRIVAEYADAVAVLVDGAIQFHGTPAALFEDPETLSSAHLARPPLAALSERIPSWSGLATLDRCYRWCIDRAAPSASCGGHSSSSAVDGGTDCE
ncbi:ABC transporter ATP-binding protein (plasmid) [Haloarcula salina]|uniref:ABC transporter ATP-binding protein n=1 Tax=Haloarcula salina TaxID=1429914 RepID=UPI003C6FF865